MTQKVFVEIGTNSFDTLIDLAAAGWRGVMVEAIPRYIEELKTSASRHPNADTILANTTFVNMAVAVRGVSVVPFVFYDPDIVAGMDSESQWLRGVGHVVHPSHSGEKLISQKHNPNPEHVTTIAVPAITMDELFDSLKLSHIDLLKMDVEGYETDLMMDYSWKIRPSMLKFEHTHIDDRHMKTTLERLGYYVWVESRDIYAVLK